MRRCIAVLFGLGFGLALGAGGALRPEPALAPGRPAPRQLLVKVKAPLAGRLEAALPEDAVGIQGTGGIPDPNGDFFARHAIQKAAPLHPDLVRMRRRKGWSDARIADGLRTAFPTRAGRLRGLRQTPDLSRTYVVEVGEATAEDLAARLRAFQADPEVEWAELNQMVKASSLSDDPFLTTRGAWGQGYEDLWGLWDIRAPQAWATATGEGIVVAVVDGGVDYNHPDLRANMWVNPGEIAGNGLDDDGNGFLDDVRGWDFVGADSLHPVEGNDPRDLNGHGTHVAGIIAATGNNGLGVIGVAYRARIMAVKGLDNAGSGRVSSLAPAMLYAARNGADVINASWGAAGHSQAMEEAIQFANSLGVVVVAAAGNDGADAWGYFPANSPEAITVAASSLPNWPWPSWSNYGSKIDVAAPGDHILSLRAAGTARGQVVAENYLLLDGTSMAAPHVSGLAALLLSQRRDFPVEQIRQTLRASAQSSPPGAWCLEGGSGRLDAAGALASSEVLEARFTAPVGRTKLAAPMTFQGIAQGAGFQRFTLEIGRGGCPSSWQTFASSTVAVAGGALGVLDPAHWVDGPYTVRLTVFDRHGQAFTDQLEVEVAFSEISSPANPAVPVTAQVFKAGAQIPIQGKATGPFFQSFQIEWARGIHPATGWASTAVTLAGAGAAPVASGLLGTWNSLAVTQADYYTLRLSVTSADGVSRCETLVYLEPDLVGQWPQALAQAASLDAGLFPIQDAQGGTILGLVSYGTLIFPTGQFHTFTPDGKRLSAIPDFPWGGNHHPAIGAVLGSGGEQVVFPAEADTLNIFQTDGSSRVLRPENAKEAQNFGMETPQLAALEGADRPLDIVALGNCLANQTASLNVWRGDGSRPFPHLPAAIPDFQAIAMMNLPRVRVGDVNGDGFKEFVVVEGTSPATFTLKLFALDGAPIPWAVPVFSGVPACLALADLDHNGCLETVMGDGDSLLHVFQPDGTERPGWPKPMPRDFGRATLAIGDLAHTGNEQIVLATSRTLNVFNADGTPYSKAWPIALPSQGSRPLVLADVDGDGNQEILLTLQDSAWVNNPDFASFSAFAPASTAALPVAEESGNVAPEVGPGGLQRLVQGTSCQASNAGRPYVAARIVAFHLDGSIVRSWNLLGAEGDQPQGEAVLAVGDFNRDGITEIACAYSTLEGGGNHGYLTKGVATVLSTGSPFKASANDWPMLNRDPQNSLVLTRVQVSPPRPSLAGVTPAMALPGAEVTLAGTGLRFATAVTFNGTPAAFTVQSDAQVTALVPPGASSGTLAVSTPGGTALGAAPFTVVPPVTVTVSPAQATVLAGSTVALTATVTGAVEQGLLWSIRSGGGTLAATTATGALFTAPLEAGTTVLTATRQADASQSGSAIITTKTRDFDGDHRTDLFDLAVIARALVSTPANPRWNALADLNGDGAVDGLDLELFLAGL